MSCGGPNNNNSSSGSPQSCCPPIVIKVVNPQQQQQNGNGNQGCCPQPQQSQLNSCCPQPCQDACCFSSNSRSGPAADLDTQECPKKERREKRWAQCNFLKPCIDGRIYRNGEYMCISYSGHIPGEMYIHGRNLPTSTTFAKRRLCQFTPYEFVDPDSCCSNCVFHG